AVIGGDPDMNTTLTYTATGLPDGAALDSATGRFTWTPGPAQTGDYPVAITVSEGERSVTQTALIRVVLNPVPPQVRVELTPSFPAVPGQQVVTHVSATSLSGIAGLTLTADGQPVSLDGQGRGTFVPAVPGRILLAASATDGDGQTGVTSAV